MPQPFKLDRPTYVRFKVPESVATRLRLILFSELEGRVPQGAYQKFFLERLNEFFNWRRVEVFPGMPVLGPPESIEALLTLLKEANDQSSKS